MPQLKVKSFVIFFLVFTSAISLPSYSQSLDSSASGKTFLTNNKSDNSYTDVLYTGFTYDLDAKYSNKGAWAISIGYRRLIQIHNNWGVNILTSLNCFYNGSPDIANSSPPPPNAEKENYQYGRNYFSANIHVSPSYTFSDKFLIYAGIGITYLQGSEFFTNYYSYYPYSYYYSNDIVNAWGDMFSKVAGVEFSPAGRFAMNLEYVGTRANNFFSIKAGMRF